MALPACEHPRDGHPGHRGPVPRCLEAFGLTGLSGLRGPDIIHLGIVGLMAKTPWPVYLVGLPYTWPWYKITSRSSSVHNLDGHPRRLLRTSRQDIIHPCGVPTISDGYNSLTSVLGRIALHLAMVQSHISIIINPDRQFRRLTGQLRQRLGWLYGSYDHTDCYTRDKQPISSRYKFGFKWTCTGA